VGVIDAPPVGRVRPDGAVNESFDVLTKPGIRSTGPDRTGPDRTGPDLAQCAVGAPYRWVHCRPHSSWRGVGQRDSMSVVADRG
jgi:hypothetical protein